MAGIWGFNHPGDEEDKPFYLWAGFPGKAPLSAFRFQTRIFIAEGFIILPIKGGW